MNLKLLVLESSRSHLNPMGGLPTTCSFPIFRPTLHSWPGMGDSFDDEDVDDFECEDDDLPGLRMMPVASITVRFHEKASGRTRRAN